MNAVIHRSAQGLVRLFYVATMRKAMLLVARGDRSLPPPSEAEVKYQLEAKHCKSIWFCKNPTPSSFSNLIRKFHGLVPGPDLRRGAHVPAAPTAGAGVAAAGPAHPAARPAAQRGPLVLGGAC